MDLQAQARPIISVVVRVNEAAIIGETHRRLIAAMATLGVTWEVIYVNDGSTDTTLADHRRVAADRPPRRAWSICRAISARKSPPPPASITPAATR